MSITRRSLLFSTTAIGALGSLPSFARPNDLPTDEIVIENDHLKAVFGGKSGALLSVSVAGSPHSQYTVFTKAGSKLRAVVIANPSNEDELACEVNLPGAQRLSLIAPESPEPKEFTGQLKIAMESAAVLHEI